MYYVLHFNFFCLYTKMKSILNFVEHFKKKKIMNIENLNTIDYE